MRNRASGRRTRRAENLGDPKGCEGKPRRQFARRAEKPRDPARDARKRGNAAKGMKGARVARALCRTPVCSMLTCPTAATATERSLPTRLAQPDKQKQEQQTTQQRKAISSTKMLTRVSYGFFQYFRADRARTQQGKGSARQGPQVQWTGGPQASGGVDGQART